MSDKLSDLICTTTQDVNKTVGNEYVTVTKINGNKTVNVKPESSDEDANDLINVPLAVDFDLKKDDKVILSYLDNNPMNPVVIGMINPQSQSSGENGRSIVSVDKVESDGLVDVYKITYDKTPIYSYFSVKNGVVGPQGIQGLIGLGFAGLTSNSSITIGTGSKIFEVNQAQGSNAFAVGQRIRIYQTSTPSNFMEGYITTYIGATLTVNVDAIGGSGTLASWSITITGVQGAKGDTGQSSYTDQEILDKLKNVNGAGSGLDADKVDGLEAAAFLLASAYTAADILNKIKTVDGSGSLLDSDMVDNHHASDFQLLNNIAAGSASFTGNGSRAVDKSISFGKTFSSVPKVVASSLLPLTVATPKSGTITTTGCTITILHLDDIAWTSAGTLNWIAIL